MYFNLAFLCNLQLTYTPKVGWATETTGGDVFVGHGFCMVSRAMISTVEMVSRVWIWELDGFYGLEDERTRFPEFWMEPCKTTIKGRQVKPHAVNTAKMVGLPSASFLCWLDMFFSDGTSYILIYHDSVICFYCCTGPRLELEEREAALPKRQNKDLKLRLCKYMDWLTLCDSKKAERTEVVGVESLFGFVFLLFVLSTRTFS